MENVGAVIGSLLAAIIGVAIVAVLVSKNSNTSAVITAASTGFSSILRVATSPVAGAAGTNPFSTQ